MSGTKYRGTATYFRFRPSIADGGGTVDIYTESRTFEVNEQASTIDVTVRGDTGKANLTDVPDITIKCGGLDYEAGTTSPTPEWDRIEQGMRGTVEWAPEGTATGRRKRSLKCIVKTKSHTSPYDNVAEWTLEFASDGGTVVKATW